DITPREIHNMTLIYDVLELATAVKPWVLNRVLADDDVACYLDPDIEVFASMAPVEKLARRHGIVLTPHSTTPFPRDGLLPSDFDHTVLIDEGYNVAYWNLYEREVKLGSDGYEVNGQPLRFFHYSGFDPLSPYRLSKYQPGKERIRLDE